jgi:hypothetical protein
MTLRPLVVMLALLVGWGPPRPAVGQSAKADAKADAKAVRLRIGPRVGDTLRMRFDQVVQSAGPAPQAAPVAPRSSAMHVMSRSVVERSDDAGSVVLTITDSAVFVAPGIDPRQVEAARRAMRGRWARMRVSPAGAMEMIETRRDGAESDPGAAALTRLPGTLPDTPVKVGDTWTRDLALPWGVGGGSSPFSAGGKVGVVFRLDSVTQHGTLAYISMRGALARSGVSQAGAHVNSSGTMTGRLRVDLRRGWMTESRAEFAMVTTWLPTQGSKTKPMQLRVTITQWLRCDND